MILPWKKDNNVIESNEQAVEFAKRLSPAEPEPLSVLGKEHYMV